ncbi:molybdopterin-binding/glycosyltransferase family 2 protein [Alphaproteobacteria bacterium]|nr:molybdopterin-binding/glycosyltransferase family 2 protein [Alphaproteobacteria bacterium]
MKFGEKPIADCLGDLLVHSAKTPDGKLPKGTKLTQNHIDILRLSGSENLLVASLQEDDMDENKAALAVSSAFVEAGFRLSSPATGRVNFIATQLSLVRLDIEKIKQLNEVDEAITFASIMPDQLVTSGQMIATLKIIPYAVSKTFVDAAIKIISQSILVSCHTIIPRKFSLIQTCFADTKPSVLSATEDVTRTRLAQLDCPLIDSQVVPHTSAEVANALVKARSQGAEAFLLCGASAIADRQDVLPEALRKAGGQVDHLGLPVDPGNLSMIGKLDEMLVIGMPGCARSPKLNGLDWLLQKSLAGIKLDKAELSGMAVGGLLADIASRPLPRKLIHKVNSHNHQVTGVLLAAGSSRRMGDENKLLLKLADGTPMVAWIAKTYLKSDINKLVVVTGFQQKEVRQALLGLDVQFVDNNQYLTGQASSVSRGIESLSEQTDSVLIALADMPFITPELINRLIKSHQLLPKPDIRITLPILNGRRANPVIWGRAFFDELQSISGDQGGRQILSAYISAINGVNWDNQEVIEDIDLPEDIKKLSHIQTRL